MCLAWVSVAVSVFFFLNFVPWLIHDDIIVALYVMFVQFISPGQFVAPFSLRLYVQDVGRADAFDKCALPKTNGYDNSTIQYINR